MMSSMFAFLSFTQAAYQGGDNPNGCYRFSYSLCVTRRSPFLLYRVPGKSKGRSKMSTITLLIGPFISPKLADLSDPRVVRNPTTFRESTDLCKVLQAYFTFIYFLLCALAEKGMRPFGEKGNVQWTGSLQRSRKCI